MGEQSAFAKSDSVGQELANRNGQDNENINVSCGDQILTFSEKQHNTYFYGLPINLLKEDDIPTSPHKSPSLKNVYKVNQYLNVTMWCYA